jgi:putative CocE/NonD family hydrolase
MKFALSVLLSLSCLTTGFADVQVETLSIPMRDGVELATDIYRDTLVINAPVILVRTPYDKSNQKGNADRFARAGYVVVIQDCRGTRKSEGVLAPYNNEGQDGFDTIEWITRQPWCCGRVGMMGGSYVGAVQWQAAVEQPPGLAAIAPEATWSSFYRNLYLGGAVRLSLISSWLAGNTPKPDGAQQADLNEAFLRLPLSDVDVAIGWPMPWLDAYLTHPEPSGFWTRLDLTEDLPNLKMPVLHVVGYYDFFSRESVGNFMIMQQARDPQTREKQRLILGPWDHGTVGKTTVAEVDFGPGAAVDTFAIQLDWFDRHLKQDPVAIARPFPPVQYFSMGDNVWHDSQTWPPAGFSATSFYLHSDGNANTRSGTGKLNREEPVAVEPADSFRADPANPVPASPVTESRPMKAAVWGPVDQGALEDREEMLVYTSETLSEPVSFAGNVEAKLFVSADTPDADWAVKLVDVGPDGFAQNLAAGILRGRYRESLLEPVPLRPEEIYEITVDLGPCAATVAPGHRLRVDICGSLFPLYDRNSNSGEGPFSSKTLIATESVYHSPLKASRIVLPIKQ